MEMAMPEDFEHTEVATQFLLVSELGEHRGGIVFAGQTGVDGQVTLGASTMT
jgi:hypothetical protein